MEISGTGKSPNTSLSFRYNANNEELEELFDVCDDDPPTPQFDASPNLKSENASPKRGDKTTSIIDKYFKSMRTADKVVTDKVEKQDKPEEKPPEVKVEESRSPPKEASSSPMKEYLNRLGKKSASESSEVKDVASNETWKIFHDFKFKIAQAVEDMKTRSLEDSKEKSVPRENSISDSEENSAIKDSDQSVGDTDNQVSSLNSSIQNLSELTQPLTAKANERDLSLPLDDKSRDDSSDDTQRNIIGDSEACVMTKNDSNIMEVESGVEALEDGIDGFSDIPLATPEQPSIKPKNISYIPPLPPPNFGLPPNKDVSNIKTENEKKITYFFTFTLYLLTFLVILSNVLLPGWNIWNGFLLGIWVFYIVSSIKEWVLSNYFGVWGDQYKGSSLHLKPSSAATYTIPSVKEHRPLKKFEGWINHYRFPDYDPCFYSINKTTTAFMKLEGCNLRLSYTKTKIAKRALWDEKIEKVEFYQHRLYNLTGATVALLPKGLVSRRHWSKKYPICITLNENEKIQVLEKESVAAEKKSHELTAERKKEHHSQHEMESTETNTSPEKKKKFVWRRRDRSSSVASHDNDVGKEGLRHRLVRKMHRDKKSDSIAQSTETQETAQADKNTQPVDALFHDAEGEFPAKANVNAKDEVEEDDVDDTDMSRIKEFLEETELLETGTDGTSEGEWSLHVKHSKDNHAHLFLFGRTGRDKHEWYRRIMSAINEANSASAESSTADDKTGSEPPSDKDAIEMAVYKITEKETVAFAKSAKTEDRISTDGISAALPPPNLSPTLDSYEKTFWPFLLKIIQSHEVSNKCSSDIGIMCQLEPSPRPRKDSRSRKKTRDSRQSVKQCECRALSSEVTWLNTVLARVVYDITRNQHVLAKLQTRIQRKLHTLKLPSFMSPLAVTELSLAGACPLVERVSVPATDERGVWLDADLRYDGGGYISVLTQINLMKLKEKKMDPYGSAISIDKKEEEEYASLNPMLSIGVLMSYLSAEYVTLEEQLHPTLSESLNDIDINPLSTSSTARRGKAAVYDSDVEDSAESSDDDETPPLQPVDSSDTLLSANLDVGSGSMSSESATAAGSSKKKFLRMVDKIATNKYFQQVTDYKYVKRAMEGLSNTDIKLQIEVQGLEGRLAINFPPPPHDRVWFGFRTNPQLVLKARPAVGQRTLRFAHISNWIEQKLSKEFEKVLVLPNMEDILCDIMVPTPLEYKKAVEMDADAKCPMCANDQNVDQIVLMLTVCPQTREQKADLLLNERTDV